MEAAKALPLWADRGRILEVFGLCKRDCMRDCSGEVAAYFRKFYGRRFAGEIQG